MTLAELVDYLDRYLAIHALSDASVNGLQVENSGTVTKVGLAVDACLESILKAAQSGCNLLLVHHGLFWGASLPICGHHYRRIRALVSADMALYAAHLPLDAHPEVGNNVQIAGRMGLTDRTPFGAHGGTHIGVLGKLPSPVPLEAVLAECRKALGPETALLLFGPDTISRIGVLSGSATDPVFFEEASQNKIDLLITGEPKQTAYSLAQELGLNIFYGGHYRTETFGVKALGSHITERFGLPVEFFETACPF